MLPLWFYLTRGVNIRDPFVSFGEKTISLEEYENNKPKYSFIEYRAFGQYFDPNPYHVWQFVANACLVIGCLSLGKDLFLSKPKA